MNCLGSAVLFGVAVFWFVLVGLLLVLVFGFFGGDFVTASQEPRNHTL